MSAAQRTTTVVAEIRKLAGGKRVVFVSGNFNIVHPGHLRLLRFAAECGEFLVVGVNPQSTDGVHMPENLRLESVRSIGFVDYAFVLPGSAEELIGLLRPAVVVKGKEHEALVNPEQAAVDAYDGKLLFGSGEVSFSSLDLLKRELQEFNLSSIVKPADFPKRHGFGMGDLKRTMAKFRGMRVAVVGDLIVDEYIDCEALGMSQEDPTLVVSPIQHTRFLGGAAIVAAHARAMGADVRYFSIAGRDAVAGYAREQLHAGGVLTRILEDDSRPTTLKQRFRAEGKTLLRVSHLRQHDIEHALGDTLVQAVREAIASTDLVIFADFNYGCLPQPLVDTICRLAGDAGVPMAADSQSSSQVGDVSRFKNMLLLTPTEREARLAVRDFGSGLVVLAEVLRTSARARNVVVTLGAEGILVHAGQTGPGGWPTDRLPAFNRAPMDPAGAGDSFLTCASMALVAGADIWESAYLGSIAAACQVGRVGNRPLSPRDIESEIDS
jgi:rfaE bifunctional protein kinase chain/domain